MRVPKLTITVGVRYTTTRQTAKGCNSGNAQTAALFNFLANIGRDSVGLPPTDAYVDGGCLTINELPATPRGTPDFLPAFQDLQQKQDNWSWRAGVNYKPTPDDLLYALVSRGYKAGVFPVHNLFLRSSIHNLSQEQLTSYEIGTKAGGPSNFAAKRCALRARSSSFQRNKIGSSAAASRCSGFASAALTDAPPIVVEAASSMVEDKKKEQVMNMMQSIGAASDRVMAAR